MTTARPIYSNPKPERKVKVRKPLVRTAFIRKPGTGQLTRSKMKVKRPDPAAYGGKSDQFPTYQQFRAFIFERDQGMCVVCGARATELAHLVKRVQGKRSTSTVNFPWNACCVCTIDARRTDVEMALCRQIVWKLCVKYSYEPPESVMATLVGERA